MPSTRTSRSGWRERRRRSASSPTGSIRAGRSRSTRSGRTSTSPTAASRGCGCRPVAIRRHGSHSRRRWTRSSRRAWRGRSTTPTPTPPAAVSGPRFNRLTPDSSVGFLSRHSWGQAVDTNTIGSCQGCAPPDMNCRTVQIFRKHGFAWGGNFLTPDGMHFEWVGEPRDQYPYPSRLLPERRRRLDAPRQRPSQTQRATLFEGDGLIAE